MKIGLIIGSNRQKSNSAKVAAFLRNYFENDDIETWALDLAKAELPLWDESIWAGDADWAARLQPISAELKTCDGFVVISPEWNGMATPHLKNFFLLWGKDEMAHKPALLVSVSAGLGGAYPIAELRMSSYKNCRLCYLPEHVIVRHANNVLNTPDSANDDDQKIRQHLKYGAELLREYTTALEHVRNSGAVDHTTFSNGM